MPTTMTSEHSIFTTDADGVRRVAGTGVTLGTDVYAFHDGATPEEIVQKDPALELADASKATQSHGARPSAASPQAGSEGGSQIVAGQNRSPVVRRRTREFV